MSTNSIFDVVIIGGGPAGLNAALILGRSRRRVVVYDSGEYRNATSRALHGFLSMDCVKPAELLRIAREQLTKYDTVELRATDVTDIAPTGNTFEVTQSDGGRTFASKILLAIG